MLLTCLASNPHCSARRTISPDKFVIATAVAACEKATRQLDRALGAWMPQLLPFTTRHGDGKKLLACWQRPAVNSRPVHPGTVCVMCSMPHIVMLLMPTAADPDLQAFAQTIVPDRVLSGPEVLPCLVRLLGWVLVCELTGTAALSVRARKAKLGSRPCAQKPPFQKFWCFAAAAASSQVESFRWSRLAASQVQSWPPVRKQPCL